MDVTEDFYIMYGTFNIIQHEKHSFDIPGIEINCRVRYKRKFIMLYVVHWKHSAQITMMWFKVIQMHDNIWYLTFKYKQRILFCCKYIS